MATKREPAQALTLSHLRREVKTSLELAVAGLAPTRLVDELATAAGLLEALSQFPRDAAPVLANRGRVVEMSESALRAWAKWQVSQQRRKGSA